MHFEMSLYTFVPHESSISPVKYNMDLCKIIIDADFNKHLMGS